MAKFLKSRSEVLADIREIADELTVFDLAKYMQLSLFDEESLNEKARLDVAPIKGNVEFSNFDGEDSFSSMMVRSLIDDEQNSVSEAA